MSRRLELRSSHVRQPAEQLVERDRIVAHRHAGGVVDHIGDGRGDPANAELGDALGLTPSFCATASRSVDARGIDTGGCVCWRPTGRPSRTRPET